MESSLVLKNVKVAYDGQTAIEDISMEIPKHQIISVIGPSGCGKSTLLHCMNGLIREESGAKMEGEILLGDQNIAKLPQDELRRRVGLVFQTPMPFPFSIYKNLVYAPKYYGVRDKAKLDAIAMEKLKMAGLYEEVKESLGKSAKKLSGGQQQRLCIARALTVEPEVLLLDEPCSALDVKSQATIEEMLKELKEHYTIVVVTHNISQAKRISDRVAFLYNGRLVEYSDAEAFFADPQQNETKAFLEGAF